MPFGRTKGGQPKNQNARSHGFYSEAFGDSLQTVFRRARNLDKQQLAEEIDALRTHLFAFTKTTNKQTTVADLQAIALMSRVIIHAVIANKGLTQEEGNAIHASMRDLINDLLRPETEA